MVTWLIRLLAQILLNATVRGDENLWVSLIVSGIVLADGDGGEKWHIRFAIDVTLHLTVE